MENLREKFLSEYDRFDFSCGEKIDDLFRYFCSMIEKKDADIPREVLSLFARYPFSAEENLKDPVIDPGILGALHEKTVENGGNHGVVYTPPVIAEYMCRECLIGYLGDSARIRQAVQELDFSGFSREEKAVLAEKAGMVRICDPAAGSGEFLIGMLYLLARIRMKLDEKPFLPEDERKYRQEILSQNLYGADIDPEAVKIMKMRLCLAAGITDFPPDMKEHFRRESSLTEKFIREMTGFDIVIGNPPYIGEKGHRELFRTVKEEPLLGRSYCGKMDYFYFFFHLALLILKPEGICSFLTTNYFPTAEGAERLRTDLKENSAITGILNFGSLRLFKEAPGQHNMILSLRKTSRIEFCHVMDVHRKGTLLPELFSGILSGKDPQTVYLRIPSCELFDGAGNHIRFDHDGNSAAEAILRKISGENPLLGELARVSTGIMGGCDAVTENNLRYHPSAGHEIQTGDGVFVLNMGRDRDRKTAEMLQNTGCLKDFFKNSDIRRYAVSGKTEKRILFSAPSDPPEQQRKIQEVLKRFRPILERIREINGEKKELWYFLRRGTSRPEIFTGEKIVCPQRSRINTFGYQENGEWYAGADVYYVTHPVGISLKYLLGFLNSRLCRFWLYHKGKRKGENLELYRTPLSRIPVRLPGPEFEKRIVEEINQILKQNDSGKISEAEKRMDSMFYDFYGLTREEILIVENFSEGRSVRS